MDIQYVKPESDIFMESMENTTEIIKDREKEEAIASPDTGYIREDVKTLTSHQREVVYFGEGPLLVVAGAGTGKTMCMAHRVSNLISSGKAEMDEVLILTFSEKAASEMEERIDILLPYAFSDIWVSTFHSFGQRILRRHAVEAGIYPDFRVLTPEEMILFLQEHIFDLPLEKLRVPSNPTLHLQSIIRLISRLKDEDISPEEYLAYVEALNPAGDDAAGTEEKELHREIAQVYRVIQDLMYQRGFVDMADLVYMPLQIFRNHPLIADEYRQQFKYILVDEFQDTNYSQYQLLKLLAEGRRNITVVGDDDQSIYKFRGAAVSNILNFMDDFPEARQVVLRKNFRSPQNILDASYRLIRHNDPYRLESKNNIDKQLEGRYDPEAVLLHRIFDTEPAQAEGVSEIIQKKLEEGYSYNDIAVLVRTNRNADAVIREFNVNNIPFSFSGSSGLYTRPEIRILLSFLRVVTRPDDSLSLFYLSSSEVYNLDASTLIRLNTYADRYNLTLEEVFRNVSDNEAFRTIPPDSKGVIERIIRDIYRFRNMSVELSAGRLLYEFLAKTGYLGRLSRRDVKYAELKTRNIALFFDLVKRFEDISEHAFALPFINYIDNLIKAGDDPPAAKEDIEIDSVSILTVHKAKGLEFPVVIIAGLAEGNFPTGSRADFLDIPDGLVKERYISDDFHVQEERRLFYVAMTRAQQELYLLGARNFTGKKRPRKVSRFLLEALDLPSKAVRIQVAPPLDVIERFAPGFEPADSGILVPSMPSILTPMHFDDYITCPLKYKFVHILKIPVLIHHRVVFGKSIREAVLDFLRRKVNDVPVELSDLQGVFAREWSQEGFLSRKHETMRFEAGVKALEQFYYRFNSEVRKDSLVDKTYRFFIDEIRVSGRWDLLKEEPEGTVLMDFRSSEVLNEKTADRKARESLRNRISVLAFRETYGKLPARLESFYLGSGIKGTVKVDDKKTEELKKSLRDAAVGIQSGDFTPKSEYYKCSMCAYVEICPATAKDL
jgi:DNA helicase II / ATP-dependent DNA helicase PcrA